MFLVFFWSSNLLGATPEQLLAREDLADILLYHVVSAALTGEEVAAEMHIETLLGKDVDITLANDKLYINGAEVVANDIEASNGVIHIIDGVLHHL